MDPVPHGVLAHSTEGRVRVRIPERRGDVAYFGAATARLGEHPAVVSAESNPLTASLVVRFEGEFGPIAEWMREQGVFAIGPAPPPQDPRDWARAALGELDRLDERIRSSTGGRLDLAGIATIAKLGLAVYQARRSRLFPPAVSLLTEGLSGLIRLAREREARAGGAPVAES
jgi:hypothetical protein